VTIAAERALCSLENYLELPDHTMDERIADARRELGRDCVILGHHYQRDEVIRFADLTGDSYKLSKISAEAEGRLSSFAACISWPKAPIFWRDRSSK